MSGGAGEAWVGKLLVATPLLTERPFARTVVQLLQHAEGDGALGLVLNRPTELTVQDEFLAWTVVAAEPVVLFEGGPVEQDRALCLARVAPSAPRHPAYTAVPGALGLATADLGADPAEPVRQARVFLGYAGWSVGQLEAEVDAGAWWVVDALPGDAFTARPDLLWRQVLKRQPAPLAMAAHYPTDPSLN